MSLAYVCSRAALLKCSSLTSVFTQMVTRMSNNEALLLWFRPGINVFGRITNHTEFFILILFAV